MITELSLFRQEMAGRFDAVERRFDTVDEHIGELREKVTTLREARAAQDGGIRLGAWIADAGRMIFASIAGVLLSWFALHH